MQEGHPLAPKAAAGKEVGRVKGCLALGAPLQPPRRSTSGAPAGPFVVRYDDSANKRRRTHRIGNGWGQRRGCVWAPAAQAKN
eukprot:12154662-Alexandrium_andersonii.AAC.1